jgi:hypothetical protein
MKLYSILLLLPLFASAASLDHEPRGVQFFSICGQVDPAAKILALSEAEKITLSGDGIPSSPGFYCVRGNEVSKVESTWHLKANGAHPRAEPPKFPVMICAKMFSDKLYTYWNDQLLHFKGPFPEREDGNWCADGKTMPKKTKGDWRFDSDQFRPMPGRSQRSGVTIGNQ